MGNTPNPFGKPVYSQTPTQTVADLQAAADFADRFAHVRVGTRAEREGMPEGQRRNGGIWVDPEEDVVLVRPDANDEWRTMWSDSGWLPVGTFGSGFVPYSGTGWTGVRYRIISGMCYVNGAAINNGGSWVTGAPICNIPAGGRPNYKWQGINVQVETNGNVIAGAGGTGALSFSASYPVA